MKRKMALVMAFLLVFGSVGCAKEKVPSADTQAENSEKQEDSLEESPSKSPEINQEEEQKGITTEVVNKEPQNMISNGDFSKGLGRWKTYTQGGGCGLDVNAEGQLEVLVNRTGTLAHSVQIYLDEFKLDSGCEYRIEFDVASSVDRSIEWRIQLNGGDYHAYVGDKINVTSQLQHVETTFVMDEASDPAPRLAINMGLVEGTPENLEKHTIVFDNFEMYLLDESEKVEVVEVKTPNININQVGYQPEDTKIAVFRGELIDETFDVVDVSSGSVAFSGKITGAKKNEAARETNAYGDFTSLTTEGTYKVVSKSCGESYPFTIGEKVYSDVFKAAVKMIYLQRCGEEITKEYGNDFAHEACHTGKGVIYGSAVTKDVSGGWHDAGDYGRYTVSGAKAAADLLYAYELYGKIFGDNLDIPESGNGIPDVLDEVRYELEWLLKMQEDKSGGVYHKVTCENFPETVMPEDEKEQLVIAPISNCATGDFAAVMALASRVYDEFDAAFAKKCLKASKNAYAYLLQHEEDPGFKNPQNIVTGEYPDTNDKDELFWALAELYKTTGDTKYQDALKALKISSVMVGLGWQNVGTYGMYSYLTSDNTDQELYEDIYSRFMASVNAVVTNANSDGYNCSIGSTYYWGSNMGVANNGMRLLMAYQLEKKDEYLNIAKQQLDYLLGANATSYCFVTQFGTLSPQHPHHRPSQSLGQAMPGMLVGGPDSNLEDPYAKATLQKVSPAKCYVDNEQSFSCNEITVYWNSPLVYLLAGLEANN